MKSVPVKSLAWAFLLTAVPVGLAAFFAYTYEPTLDGNDSDLRGAGAFIYYSPYMFSFFAVLFFVVGSVGHIIRSRRHSRSVLAQQGIRPDGPASGGSVR